MIQNGHGMIICQREKRVWEGIMDMRTEVRRTEDRRRLQYHRNMREDDSRTPKGHTYNMKT